MTDALDNYASTSLNWRKTINENNRRTYFVIAIFFLVYFMVGIIIDMLLLANTNPLATMPQLFSGLIHLQVLPIATIIMLIIASVSLFVAYSLHDTLMLLGTNAREITSENATSMQERQLYNVVDEMRISAGLRYMPRIYIIDADYMNAFASGYSEKSAMIAITTGLMEKLNRDELQAVIAHELSHIRHLDIKLTLTATLLANMTIIVLDIFFRNMLFERSEGGKSRNNLLIIIMLLRFLLPVISIFLLLYLSRRRELMADAGCVELTRNNAPLATALIKISGDYQQHEASYSAALAATPHENIRREAYLFDPCQAGISSISSLGDMFSTHPSLETRLKALGYVKK